MKIRLHWHEPFRLRDGTKLNLVYRCDELNEILEGPGIYVFARKFGSNMIPLYVGQASRLRKRIEYQLKNNVRLMKGIENAESGKRFILHGEVLLAPGQQQEKVLDIIEKAYIKTALSQGYELLNKQGTRTKVHRIKSEGRKHHHNPFPRKMNVEKRR